MGIRPRSIAFLSAVVALAGILTSCDGGGGGTQRVYFSLSDYDGCATAYVKLKSLEDELARNPDRSPACTLSPELSDAGCHLVFTELDEGQVLEAAISGCRVPKVANLFSCDYVKVNVVALNTEAAAACGCLTRQTSCYINGICDLCAGRQGDRQGCEDCTNHMDDDGDHQVDCDDMDCELTMDCGFGRTTLMCSSTTTTTNSTMPAFEDESSEAPMSELPDAGD